MSTKRKAESRSRAANRPRIMKPGDSRTDSERDSGFSDASSEYMSTINTKDTKDFPHPVGQQGPQTSGSQLAVVGGSYSNMSPMIIMNNVLLKKPGDNPPALKPWGVSPKLEVVQPMVQQPQVVFLQPVVSHQVSPTPKETTRRHSQPKKYLPVLKSYPKIAPHPGDSSSGRGPASSSSSTPSSASKRASSSNSKHREHSHREKQPRTLGSNVSKPGLNVSPLLHSRLSSPATDTISSTSSSPAREPSLALNQSESTNSISFKQTPDTENQTASLSLKGTHEEISVGKNGHSDFDADTRRKRFCNTYNILSNSGLLDITLRTKELLRQNRHTQKDIDRLKEHTSLFLQALQSGDFSICGKLQANLNEEDTEREREVGAQASL